MICPHCGKGKMIERKSNVEGYIKWQYPYGYWDCDNCGRGWLGQSNGTMVSEGATDKEIYDPKTKKMERLTDPLPIHNEDEKTFTCPHCGYRQNFDQAYADSGRYCPNCDARLDIPLGYWSRWKCSGRRK